MGITHISFGGAKGWLSSAWEFPVEAKLVPSRLTKRRDGVDAWWLRRPWSMSTGLGKSHYERIPLVATPSVTWHAVVLTRRQVKSELRSIRNIGALRRHGYGKVRRWEVEHVAGDPLRVLARDGIAMRHLPLKWCQSGDVGHGAWRPPYWYPGFSGARVSAGARVVLCPEVKKVVRALAST